MKAKHEIQAQLHKEKKNNRPFDIYRQGVIDGLIWALDGETAAEWFVLQDKANESNN